MTTANNRQLSFYHAFNEAYQSYLNGISSWTFMNAYLDNIINVTNSKLGFIASIQENQHGKYLVTEALSNYKWINSEIFLPGSMTINVNTKSLCTYSIFYDKILITNDVANHEFNMQQLKWCEEIKTFASVPYHLDGKIAGVVGVCNADHYDDIEVGKDLEILGNLTATLQYSYYNFKKSSQINDSRSITYKFIEEIIDSTYDGIVVTNGEYDIILINNSAKDIIKQVYNDETIDSIVGKNAISILPQLEKIFSGDKANKFFKNRKIEIVHNDGDTFIAVELIVNSMMFLNNIYHMVVIHDVTEKVMSREKLNKNQNNFIAFLSHELRNPLQSITIAGQLMEINLEDCKLKQNASIINRAASDMKKIINDVLDLSKLDAEEFTIDLDMHDINEIVDNIVLNFGNECQEKSLRIVPDVSDNVPIQIFTDIVRINQILSNLLSNAIKYTITQNSDILFKVGLENNFIRFDIIDKGIGIKKTELGNLFKDFGQTSNSNKYGIASTGLGLSISQKIANLLGGKITVQSSYGKGSVFSFYHPNKLNKTTPLQRIRSVTNLRGKVLIIDDNESNLALLKMLIDHFNCIYSFNIDVNCVSNGSDAIEMVKNNNYDLVFLDINMHGIDGVTTSKILRNMKFSGKIIAATGNIFAKKENRNDDRFDNFDDVIIKPYDDQQILGALKKYLI